MLSFKLLIGFICLMYPTRAEGSAITRPDTKPMIPNSMQDPRTGKMGVHADQIACGTNQALTKGHAT